MESIIYEPHKITDKEIGAQIAPLAIQDVHSEKTANEKIFTFNAVKMNVNFMFTCSTWNSTTMSI